jgi:hypothetical protein
MQAPILPDTEHLHQSMASNDPLRESTQNLVYKHIAEVEEQVVQIDREIEELLAESLRIQCRLEELEKEKVIKSDQLKTLNATLSPLELRLSPELLSEIFLKYTESLTTHLPRDDGALLVSDIDGEIYNRGNEVDIWGLGHVCAQWRHVLWNTPGIFHTIAVRTPKDPSRIRNIWNLLNEILSRTTGLIDLSISNYPSAGVTDLVISFNNRFHRLSLSPPTDLEPLLDLPIGSFGVLTDLQLEFPDESVSPTLPPSAIIWRGLPKIRKLTLAGVHWLRSLRILLSPAFTQLTDLKIASALPCQLVHGILYRSNNLIRAQFLIGARITPIYSTSPIVMPYLEVLDLSILTPFDWALFLKPLVTNLLKKLHSHDSCDPPSRFYPRALTSLIERSRCSIDCLEVATIRECTSSDIELGDQDLIPMLRMLPCLEAVTASFVTPPEVFNEMQRGLLPSLTDAELTLDPTGLGTLIDYLFFNAQQSKWPWTDTRILSIMFICHPTPGFNDACRRYFQYCSEYDVFRSGVSIHGYNSATGTELLETSET